MPKEYGVEEYVNILCDYTGGIGRYCGRCYAVLGILGLPPNSLSTEESIKQGVKYFSELLASSERLSVI